MLNKNKCNYISIAKAIGIILMVIGHSGCPYLLNRFLYSFHIPLFFLCSGYFFKEITGVKAIHTFLKKRIKKLYYPYLKWSLLFLLLHNLFFKIGIYNSLSNSNLYQTTDFARQLFKIFFMTDYELLLRPFWFIKELFYASILIAIISLLRSKMFSTFGNEVLLLVMLICSMICKYINLAFPIIGNCSLLSTCAVYFYSGMVFRKYENKIPNSVLTTVIVFLTTIIGSYCFDGRIDMRYTTIYNMIPYYILSISGIIMIFNISKRLNNTPLNTYLYYIGNHTMIILALNLLALKVGNLIKIWYYSLPIKMLSSYTIINEYNSTFWLLYTFIGVTIPLLIHYLYNLFHKQLKLFKEYYMT